MAKTKSLIIVESPAKIKTLKKFLGPSFAIESSVGHIRDLPQKGFGIDIEHNFEPKYAPLPDKKEVIANLQKAAKQADIVYLSPDPDREGEAIAWHIASLLPKGCKYKRVTFNAITKEAVLEALKHPRNIDNALVDAQQARRLLDRIVGYKISPILTRRVQRAKEGGLSAGRVQSVALMLVVHREMEIESFVPKEYWNMAAVLKNSSKPFKANLYSLDGKRIEKDLSDGKFYIPNQKMADEILARMKKANYLVEKVEKKEKKRYSVPPFITSTLQQEASRHYGFSASRTMNIAQGLYEGIDLGQSGPEGLITYMRTDSVRIEPVAIEAARKYILQTYGKEYLPEEPKQFTTKKSAQDAHEAIRPTSIQYPPDVIKPYLTDDQYKLYVLIWKRFVASQMNPAIYDTVSVDIATDQNMLFRASGSTIKFSGFLAVYEEKNDLANEDPSKEETLLPPLQEKEKLKLVKPEADQAFTRPPPRYTEASLVKELEKLGIGRPSTYAAIMNKIQSRDYTIKEKGSLKPTELGRVITKMLEDNFPLIMNVDFTARMEDALEFVAEDKYNWRQLLSDFWKDFEPLVKTAEKEAFVPKEMTDINCPKCGHKLQKIWARSKYFYGCSNYPECSFTSSIEGLNFKKEDYNPHFNWDQRCPKCGAEMQVRQGKYGVFLGCSKYPACNGIINVPRKDEAILGELPHCPAKGCSGRLVQRRSRFGKTFFSCSEFPACDVIVNKIDDLAEKYPNHPKTAYVKKERWKKQGKESKVEPKKEKVKKTKGKSKTSAFSFKLSDALKAVVGVQEASRPEVVKLLWDYIKKHKLQNPKNKRQIVPDAKLAKVFGSKKPIDMMKLASYLSEHLIKK